MRREEKIIIGTIPIFEADFAVFEDGTIGEIHKGGQKRGLIIINLRNIICCKYITGQERR
jgi:hypothetical protein